MDSYWLGATFEEGIFATRYGPEWLNVPIEKVQPSPGRWESTRARFVYGHVNRINGAY